MENKKVRVLLVYPDFTIDNTNAKASGGNYSEGLASISAVLKEAGHSVSLLHIVYSLNKEEFQKRLKEYEFDVVGFTTRTTAFEYVQQLVGWTREICNPFIFCGSYHCTLVPDEVIATEGVDAVCIGESEFCLREFCDRYFTGDYYDVQSMYFKKPDGEIIRNPIRPLLEDLDELPIPDFDLFDYANLDTVKAKTAIVMMSRGCLFSCTYCGNSQFRNVYPNKKKYCRFRSPENAIHYLEVLLEKHPEIEVINFRDAIFNMYTDWFDEFIQMYTEKFALPFTCNLRLDCMTEDCVRRMKEAGCYLIDVGVESGDYDIRRKYLKRLMTDEQMINAFSLFRKYNITSLTYNIVGLPYENLHKALQTIKLNVTLNPHKAIPNIFTPYPMTILRQYAEEVGTILDRPYKGTEVTFYQEEFPPHQVQFAANYFNFFIKRYKGCRKMPKWLGTRMEKMWDAIFVGKLTPRKFLNVLYKIYYKTRWKLRNFAVRRLPKLFMALKKRRLERQIRETEKNPG
ncbi:MAG: B12-binding domain-containing radical SAM protein [Ruminococcaceae bacterium]|nr:B12-binding domain-containing radical SAM protein [Oscillospiraceae bacterium]